MAEAREMISFALVGGRFRFRAAAVAMRDGHVLVHRAQWDEHWSLPGGRVELGEESATALAREIEEELGVSGAVGPLRFIMENLFVDNQQRCHEIGFYYGVTLPDRFPFRLDGEVCHTCQDGEARLQFKWVSADADTLERINFHPMRLRGLLLGPDSGPVHLTDNELDR